VDANIEGFNFANYRFEGGGTTSAYIDDNRFAALGLDGTARIGTPGGNDTAVASFAIASAGLVGTSELQFAGDPNLNPQFSRWGWWSASLEVPVGNPDDNLTRTDIIHLGNWVAGVRVDFNTDDIPSAGVAQYAGLAVGTKTDLASFDRQIVGGNFAMTYNFGSQSGNFNLNIPDASINETVTISGFTGSDVFSGRNSNTENSRLTEVNGAFFANPNAAGLTNATRLDGVAGVGGTFESTDTLNQVQTTGVFAGDRSNFAPRLTDGGLLGPDAVSPITGLGPGGSVVVNTPVTGTGGP
jgi:hypothetical protein